MLQCLYRNWFSRNSYPGIAVAQYLGVRHGPGNIEVKQVGGIKHFHHNIAAEASAVFRASNQQACGVGDVGCANFQPAALRPIINIGFATDKKLFFDVAQFLHILWLQGMGSSTEGMRTGCHWHGTSDLGELISYFRVQLLSLKCLWKCQIVQGQPQHTCKA